MEYSPPPLFKQGASARAKVVVFSMLAIFLLVADARWQTLDAIRQVIGTALYPLQRLALMPRDVAYDVGGYFSSLGRLEDENRQFMRERVANAQALQQAQLMAAENAQLRRLLGASERLAVKSLMAEILYDARDAFTRKIVLDRGSQHGVKPGQPVIDDTGVVGQVTRVFPFTSETTLLTDKDQAIPVQVVRSGLRSIAYGGKSGTLDLRFMPANADIRQGDLLVTSGIDGIYPAGLAVARVAQVEHKSSDAFAKIICQPAAGIDRNRQLLILLAEFQMPAREPVASPAPAETKPQAKPPANPTPANPTPANPTPANPTPANPAPAQPPVAPVPAPVKPAPAPVKPAPAAPAPARPDNAARPAPQSVAAAKPVPAPAEPRP